MQKMIPALRIISFMVLLSAFSFRAAAAEDFTNASHVSAGPASPGAVFPGVDWERGTNGLSPEIVRAVDACVHTLDTTGLMVVQHGRVVYDYGDLKRLSYLASARKSILSMLYGANVAGGKIRLEATLKDLGMSDFGGLLPIEERAKVIDLITARSGVYHPAANGGDALSMAPKRGSKEPDTYWLYNNWDFNAAGAAFERMTGKNIYDALRDDLAIPIGMQDFDRQRQQKSGDLTHSQYAAYHMLFSTRDMARLGLLMLRQGQWRDRQIIPADWVRRSTSARTPVTEVDRAGPFGYGWLWWVWDGPFAAGPYRGAYTAYGAYGQFITVFPALDMVVAHKTCGPGNVILSQYLRLLDLLTGRQPASAAELASWDLPQPKVHAQSKAHIAIKLNPQVLDAYVGRYTMAPDAKRPDTEAITFTRDGDALIGEKFAGQKPRRFGEAYFPESETNFFNTTEDEELTFLKNDRGEVTGVSWHENGAFGEFGRREYQVEK
jgi:CubicO group peptidase (beta-lactamase class C family)